MRTFHGYRWAATYNGPSYSAYMSERVELFRSIDTAREAFRDRVNGSGAWPQSVTEVELENGIFKGEPVTDSLLFPATTDEDRMDLYAVYWDERAKGWAYAEYPDRGFVVGARQGYVRTERY